MIPFASFSARLCPPLMKTRTLQMSKVLNRLLTYISVRAVKQVYQLNDEPATKTDANAAGM